MFRWQFAKDYLLHRLTAKTRHGLHSPFVYHLVDKVIYDFKPKKLYGEIENFRNQLLNDDKEITVTDLGAGSHVNNNQRKKVSQIAKNALKPPKMAQLLFRLAEHLHPKHIIELGTCLGITSIYLQKAAPDAKVYTMEGCPQTAGVAQEVFTKAGAKDIKLTVGNFNDTLPALINTLPQLDFVFIDGNHQKQATLDYFNWCLPRINESSMLIFDDIYWSEGMKEAWAEIKAHPDVTITVDLFWIGLVFFKKGRLKEDFKIKI